MFLTFCFILFFIFAVNLLVLPMLLPLSPAFYNNRVFVFKANSIDACGACSVKAGAKPVYISDFKIKVTSESSTSLSFFFYIYICTVMQTF